MAKVTCPNCGGENEVFSKKGQECEYCGSMLHLPYSARETVSAIDDGIDAALEERRDEIEEELKEFNRKYHIFLFISGVFTFLIGMLCFLLRNNSLHERIEKRLNNQKCFVGLLDKLQRKKNLANNGASAEQLKAIDEDIFDGFDDSDADSEDDITPKSISEIHDYVSETEYLKEKLTKRMKRFWLWYILIIIFVGGGIGGYYYWDKAQTEKICHQEYEERMAKISQLEEELNATITSEFAEKFIGKTFEGSLTDNLSLDEHKLIIHFIDKSHLTCKCVTQRLTMHLDYDKSADSKDYTYELEIKGNIAKDYEYQAQPEVVLRWGNYKTENIVDCLGKLNEPFNHIPFKTYFKVIQGNDVYLMSIK